MVTTEYMIPVFHTLEWTWAPDAQRIAHACRDVMSY